MHFSLSRLITSILLLSLSGLAYADDFADPNAKNWQLKIDNNNILVHTRKTAGSNYHVVRLAVEVKSTPENIVLALGKGDGCEPWLAVCISSKAIEKASNNTLIYSVMRMPWPLKTRDYVYRSVIERFKQTGVIITTQTSEPQNHPKKNYIRMLTQSKFVLEPINSTRTKITWYVHPNLGGNAFPSIVNTMAYKETLRDLMSLKSLVEK